MRRYKTTMSVTTEATAPATLTVEEAGELLNISRSLAYQGVKSGAIPSIRIGRRLLVPRVQLERLLAGEERSAPAAVER